MLFSNSLASFVLYKECGGLKSFRKLCESGKGCRILPLILQEDVPKEKCPLTVGREGGLPNQTQRKEKGEGFSCFDKL